MNRQMVMGIGGCALAILLLPAAVLAKKSKFRTCGKPLPLQLRPFTNKPQRIDSLCRNTGCFKSAANDKQNAMKNNFCAPTNKIIPVTLQTFVDLRDAANSEASITIGEPPPSRAKLANIIKLGNGTRLGEGKTVVFVGYVLDARHSNVDKDDPLNKGNGESVQCNLLGCAYNDIHIDLTADRNDRTPCHSIVAEIIPHYRPPAWDLFDSPDYAAFRSYFTTTVTWLVRRTAKPVLIRRGTMRKISSGWRCGRFIRSTRSTFARTPTGHNATQRTRAHGFLSPTCSRVWDSPA